MSNPEESGCFVAHATKCISFYEKITKERAQSTFMKMRKSNAELYSKGAPVIYSF